MRRAPAPRCSFDRTNTVEFRTPAGFHQSANRPETNDNDYGSPRQPVNSAPRRLQPDQGAWACAY
ncbi:hypothetical protein SBBP1_320044 [Burkholderiales bacterium]|nr:hypothetical protein SBBP1_320044 [Burkholderiales bacterium]